MTKKAKRKIKRAKREWKNMMLRKYDSFTSRKWASTSYRMEHPQF